MALRELCCDSKQSHRDFTYSPGRSGLSHERTRLRPDRFGGSITRADLNGVDSILEGVPLVDSASFDQKAALLRTLQCERKDIGAKCLVLHSIGLYRHAPWSLFFDKQRDVPHPTPPVA